MIISSKNNNGSLRYADIYDQHVRKIQVRPVAGRYQLIVAENYKKAVMTQDMVNNLCTDVYAILDNRTKRSMIVDTDDSKKVISIAKNIARLI